ncbi:MAG TPA: S-methyl-5'-thioadenosine phosphorylase, partial [Methylocella sp.]
DRTFAREKSFFGPGFVAHVPMAHPVCPKLSGALTLAAREQKIDHSEGGTYICMEGPQFSSRAESFLYRSWDCSVIGMTAMPEAKLAREAEISYATIAMVTDFDCWHPKHENVDVAAVIRVVQANAGSAAKLLTRLLRDFPAEHEPCPAGSDRALDHALLTPAASRDKDLMKKLEAIMQRVNS